MRNVLLLLMCLVVMCSVAIAGVLERTGGYTGAVAMSPNGTLQRLLTINSSTIDMSRNFQWLIYSPTACVVRTMPTSSKSTYKTSTIPVNTFIQRGINTATPFVNFSGCTNGQLHIQ